MVLSHERKVRKLQSKNTQKKLKTTFFIDEKIYKVMQLYNSMWFIYDDVIYVQKKWDK